MLGFKKAYCAYALLTTTCAVAIAFSTVLRESPAAPELRLSTLNPSPLDVVVTARTEQPPIVAPMVAAPVKQAIVPALVPAPVHVEQPKQPAAPAPVIAFASPPPARFFTINQVMAKRAGRPIQAEPIKLASLDNSPAINDGVPSYAPRDSRKPFGMTTFRAPDGLLWSKWRTIEKAMQQDSSVIAACRANLETCKSREARHYISVVDKAKTLHGRDRLQEVHKAVNISIRYLSDMAQHHVADLWSTALASFTTGYGDCEDYAIANYEILQDTGIAADDMQILLVRDKFKNEDHAVLAVRDDGTWLILDSRKPYLVETKDVPHYMPLYAINHDGVRLFAAPYAMRTKHESEAATLPASAEAGQIDAVGWAFKAYLD